MKTTNPTRHACLGRLFGGIFLAMLLSPAALQAGQPVVHYFNLDDPGNEDGRARKVWPGSVTDHSMAQKFVAAVDNVTSVTLGLARLGAPGGTLSVQIWTPGSSGLPGESLGEFAKIDVDTLPQISRNSLPPFVPTRTLTGLVTGLTPGNEYFLLLRISDDAQIADSSSYVVNAVDSPVEAEPITLFDGGSGGWIRPFGQRLHAEIAGTTLPVIPEPRIEKAIRISWPTTAEALILERSPTLEGPWETVTEPVQVIGEENHVTVLTTAPKAFFRLRCP